ncbi:hypothetical protein OSB04_010660 [Centaurea solstitialis]|uniref:RING-type E3 ubiquitin transferase n=1 Tax=Centaurea solstitialis TaxID=347529 RepID=A0AA38TIS5_9ASTR|nr:hypothetical protein OSB04_010660 [Centaurea solstitialis]
MGGCCSSSRKFPLHGTPVYYYVRMFSVYASNYFSVPKSVFCPPALEEHESSAPHDSGFPTRLLVDVNLDTSIPDTFRSPPRPIPFDVVLGISQSTNPGPDIDYRKPTHVDLKELDRETERDTPFIESPKKVEVGFQESKCVDGLTMEEEEVCPTCFEEYDAQNPTIVTKCNHRFHLSCILEWMERSDTCPICNQAVARNLLWDFIATDMKEIAIYEIAYLQQEMDFEAR